MRRMSPATSHIEAPPVQRTLFRVLKMRVSPIESIADTGLMKEDL